MGELGFFLRAPTAAPTVRVAVRERFGGLPARADGEVPWWHGWSWTDVWRRGTGAARCLCAARTRTGIHWTAAVGGLAGGDIECG